MKKRELFTASVKCPRCGKAMKMHMRITLRNKDIEWYKKNHNTLDQIGSKYNVFYMECDDFNKDGVLIDFGWKEPPSVEQVQKFTDEVIELL